MTSVRAILGELCRRCDKPRSERPHVGRGLCQYCYSEVKRFNQLDRYPVAPRPKTPEVPGVSYRQLDYWVRQGYLRPEREVDDGTGPGIFRRWSDEEVRVARVMARLVGAGLTPKAAAHVARGHDEIGPGVRVVLS